MACILLFTLAGMIFRAAQLQLVRGEMYRENLEQMRLSRSFVPATRGSILDRNGAFLANSTVSRQINITETFKGVFGQKRAELLFELSLLTGLSEVEIREKMGKGQNIPLGSETTVSNPLVLVEYDFLRHYPFSGSISHVLGYTRQGVIGVAGVEKSFDSWLAGTPGQYRIEMDSSTRQLSTHWIQRPVPGKDLVLSIDLSLMQFLDQLLAEQGKNGVILVSNPATGEILGMASHPYVDSQKMAGDFSEEEWENITADPTHPLVNRAIQTTYHPGSLVKPLISLCALSQPAPFVQQLVVGREECKGTLRIPTSTGIDAIYRDWRESGHGVLSFFEAIEKSCNVFFYRLGMKVGIDAMVEFVRNSALTQVSGIELAGEVPSIFPSEEWKMNQLGERWYLGDTILTSIGQGFVQFTPMGMLKMLELIANEGWVYDSTLLRAKKGTPRKSVFLPDSYWNYLKSAMGAVVSRPGGTAYSVFRDWQRGKELAGKTGTAETGEAGVYHSWFGGFFPKKEPRIAILVLVEKGGFGSETATPLARKVLEWLEKEGKLPE
ncbi:MAG TPA: penicillin-binding transpeptidase domain-containing protein [Thermotogota bacterium]|nr:penicillin-binding transpeptidase domain-containing protein [Thermotogota bacterium]